jgi:hypothetical protein
MLAQLKRINSAGITPNCLSYNCQAKWPPIGSTSDAPTIASTSCRAVGIGQALELEHPQNHYPRQHATCLKLMSGSAASAGVIAAATAQQQCRSTSFAGRKQRVMKHTASVDTRAQHCSLRHSTARDVGPSNRTGGAAATTRLVFTLGTPNSGHTKQRPQLKPHSSHSSQLTPLTSHLTAVTPHTSHLTADSSGCSHSPTARGLLSAERAGVAE